MCCIVGQEGTHLVNREQLERIVGVRNVCMDQPLTVGLTTPNDEVFSTGGSRYPGVPPCPRPQTRGKRQALNSKPHHGA